jgi:hypothetical protein
LATAFSEMSGTVLPITTWNTARSSSGARGNPSARANSSDELMAKREP